MGAKTFTIAELAVYTAKRSLILMKMKTTLAML